MRHAAALLALTLMGCSPAGRRSAPDRVSPAAPAPVSATGAARPATPAAVAPPPLLSEPSAVRSVVGRVYTLGDLRRLAPLADVVVEPKPPTHWNGIPPVAPGALERLLAGGEPVAPDAALLGEWHYARWCDATFTAADGRRWSAALYLGGLGVLTDDAGRNAAFRFEPPRKD